MHCLRPSENINLRSLDVNLHQVDSVQAEPCDFLIHRCHCHDVPVRRELSAARPAGCVDRSLRATAAGGIHGGGAGLGAERGRDEHASGGQALYQSLMAGLLRFEEIHTVLATAQYRRHGRRPLAIVGPHVENHRLVDAAQKSSCGKRLATVIPVVSRTAALDEDGIEPA